jgi:hypothetical protein
MKSHTIRFIVALITFIVGVAAASLWFFYPSYKSENPAAQIAQPRTQTRSEEILRVLMPNGIWGDASQLDKFDRSEEIQVLKDAQVKAKDERAIGIAFLLAALGHDYEVNRDVLLKAMSECAQKSYPEEAQCNFFVADYLMELCRRGDASLYQPIFNVSDEADGAFSQSLGNFYSDMLREQPEQFLKALASRPRKEQRDYCQHASSEDGSGMGEERLRDVRQVLSRISALPDRQLAPVARTCLLAVEAGNESSMEAAKKLKGK